MVQRSSEPWRSDATLRNFWSQFLESPRTTDVVLADTSFTFAQDVLGVRIPLSSYLNRSYVQQFNQVKVPDNLKHEFRIMASRSNTSYGDFRAAQWIFTLAPQTSKLRLEYARDLRSEVIKSDNLILIGSSYSNPWSSLYESRLNFRAVTDPQTHQTVILNTHPTTGEPSTYSVPIDPGTSAGYSVIAFFPSARQSPNVLMLAGPTGEATEAAGEFITSSDTLDRVRKILKVENLRGFEVLLKTTKLGGTPPLRRDGRST